MNGSANYMGIDKHNIYLEEWTKHQHFNDMAITVYWISDECKLSASGLNGTGQSGAGTYNGARLQEQEHLQEQACKSECISQRLLKLSMNLKLFDIKAEKDNSYAKSDENLHWVLGDNHWGQLQLQSFQNNNVYSNKDKPFLLNDIFHQKSGKSMTIVYLGADVLYIVATKASQRSYTNSFFHMFVILAQNRKVQEKLMH